MRKRLSRRHFLGAGAGALAAAGGLAWLYQPRKIGAPLGDLISDSNGMLDFRQDSLIRCCNAPVTG